MRVEYKELMDLLGVGHVLAPYETRPWYLYDAERGITCSAEVRAGPSISDIEGEIQFLYDERSANEDGTEARAEGMEQILLLRIMPFRDQLWTPTLFIVKGQNYVGKIYDWESRACKFFLDCIQALQMNELPEIDDMIQSDLDDERAGGRGKRGKVGKNNPKVNPNSLMGMKT